MLFNLSGGWETNKYLVSSVLKQFSCSQSSHPSPNNNDMIGGINAWKAIFQRLQQKVIVFVLQAFCQMLLQTSSSNVAAAHSQQQQTDGNWIHQEKLKGSVKLTWFPGNIFEINWTSTGSMYKFIPVLKKWKLLLFSKDQEFSSSKFGHMISVAVQSE